MVSRDINVGLSRARYSAILGAFTLIASCAPSAPSPPDNQTILPLSGAVVPRLDLKTLPQTIGLEQADRQARWNRAKMYGIEQPIVDAGMIAVGQVPGVNYPVPVTRIVFPDKVFFDFDKDTPRPGSGAVLDFMANNLKHDVPDISVLILGHTDNRGTPVYNAGLSQRRADSVIAALVSRGVNPAELAAKAIGGTQPVASNATEQGRTRNRRVELLIAAKPGAIDAFFIRRHPDPCLLSATGDCGSPKPIRITPPPAPSPVDGAKPTPVNRQDSGPLIPVPIEELVPRDPDMDFDPPLR